MRFPRVPFYSGDFLSLANLLSNNFDQYFVEYNGSYFIGDQSVACTYHQKRKRYISSFLKRNLTKILNGENPSLFLQRFSKPSDQNVRDYLSCRPYLKYSFIQIAKIRKIDLFLPIWEENPLSCITCTCPDFKDAAFCIHSLAVLLKKGYLKQDLFRAQKKRGRKTKVPYAWEQDNSESSENDIEELGVNE